MEEPLRTLETRRGDRLHKPLNEMLIYISVIARATMVESRLPPIEPGTTGTLKSPQTSSFIVVPLYEPFAVALAERAPDTITLAVIASPPPELPFTSAGASGLTLGVFSALFALACDGALEWQKARRPGPGTDVSKWPPVLNFCRVVRNAISHGGRLNLASKNAFGGQWRNLRYTKADDGKQIIGQDLGPGDLIMLLFDLSEELDREGAPATW